MLVILYIIFGVLVPSLMLGISVASSYAWRALPPYTLPGPPPMTMATPCNFSNLFTRCTELDQLVHMIADASFTLVCDCVSFQLLMTSFFYVV